MSSSDQQALGHRVVVVFAKEAEPGRVKTRLAADLGDERAAKLYRCFMADLAETIAGVDGVDSLLLAYAGDPSHPGFEPFREAGFEFVTQRGSTLGERMDGLVERCIGRGAGEVVIVGTDSPTLTASHIQRAFEALGRADVALGPSFDGGYYLIGLSGRHSAVFDEIDWSTPHVLGQSLRRCRAASLLCELLEFWYDVDTFDDLKLLKTHLFDYLRYRDPRTARHTAEFISQIDDGEAVG